MPAWASWKCSLPGEHQNREGRRRKRENDRQRDPDAPDRRHVGRPMDHNRRHQSEETRPGNQPINPVKVHLMNSVICEGRFG